MKVASRVAMTYQHGVLWIDHHEAKIFRVEADTFSAESVTNPHRHVRKHSATTRERNGGVEVQHYYHEVARALDDAAEVLVVGPSTAKLEFIKHVHEHDRTLVPRIVGVETADHPTDGQLVAHARQYFRAADRMR